MVLCTRFSNYKAVEGIERLSYNEIRMTICKEIIGVLNLYVEYI